MRKLLAVIFSLVMVSLMVISSSGTFVSFNAAREVRVNVVPHGEEYLGFMCDEGYSAVVTVGANEELDFEALTVRNHLNELKTVDVTLHPDYSSLPDGVAMGIETEDGSSRPIASEGEYTFGGRVSVGNVEPGEYVIPVTMEARWSGGDAWVSTCPIKLIIVGGPEIRKTLIAGELSVPSGEPAQWTFRIALENPGKARNLTVEDRIPSEFAVVSVSPSTGLYSLTQGEDYANLTWNVSLNAGEGAYIDVTLRTEGFGDCGEHVLNPGAKIVGYNVSSGGINVTSSCNPGTNDCRMCVSSKVLSGPDFLLPGRAADYHTRIFVKNRGEAKDVTIQQLVGPDFEVTGHSASRGSVSISQIAQGPLVTWSFHLEVGETATLDLYEHTEGIYSMWALLVGRVHVLGCGCAGCPHYVYIMPCNGCRGDDPGIEAQDNAGIESDNCEGECG